MSRDKNRILPLMKTLAGCWKTTTEKSLKSVFYELYPHTPEGWNLFYKEDDYWLNEMNKYCEGKEINNLSEEQEKVLTIIEKIWYKYYDLRFPQIIDYIVFITKDCKSNNEIIDELSKIEVKINGEQN